MTVSTENVRSGCDLLSVFLIFDEYSDREDEKGVRALASMYMNVFRNPTNPRPQGEPIVGEIVRQFWERARRGVDIRYQQRFIDVFQEFTEAVIQQAKDRHSNHLRTVDEYFTIRRGTVGMKPTLVLVLFDSDYDILPDQVFDHPVMLELEVCAIDSIITCNDIASYNREQARGDEIHNLVTVVMHQHRLGLQDALQWIAVYQEGVNRNFIKLRERLPSWGEAVDSQVQRYLESMACWVRGHDSWDWECERYFGKDGLKVKEGAPVILLSKKNE